jgi:hypothetical protein
VFFLIGFNILFHINTEFKEKAVKIIKLLKISFAGHVLCESGTIIMKKGIPMPWVTERDSRRFRISFRIAEG